MFDDLDMSVTATAELDELGTYLRAPCEAVADADVLKWWRDRQKQYPHLAIMAISYLTIPGTCLTTSYHSDSLTMPCSATSVGVERLFSRGRLLLSHVRNRLSAQTTRAILCLGEWYRAGLITETDFLTAASHTSTE